MVENPEFTRDIEAQVRNILNMGEKHEVVEIDENLKGNAPI